MTGKNIHAELMEETKYELSALFEHGLAASTRFGQRVEELSLEFKKTGMNFLAENLHILSEKLKSSAHSVGPETTELIALIWEYVHIATDRLLYFQIKEDLSEVKE